MTSYTTLVGGGELKEMSEGNKDFFDLGLYRPIYPPVFAYHDQPNPPGKRTWAASKRTSF